MNSGRCLCGTLRYEIDGPFKSMMSCHCSMCRKHHGAAYATYVSAPLSGFRWLSGEDSVSSYESSPGGVRSWCSQCGSVAPMLLSDMGIVLCPAGNLEGDLGIKPQAHIFTGSKASWFEITDSLPRYREFPPEYAAAGVQRPQVVPKPGFILGSCLCGDVAFEITGVPERLLYCHCSRCRLTHGAAHAANLFVNATQFRWLRGEESINRYKVPEARFFTPSFCERCGGSAPHMTPMSRVALVPAGLLDTDPVIKPQAHVCTESKASWDEITDRIPQHAHMPPRSTA